jgi:hypothetical protein
MPINFKFIQIVLYLWINLSLNYYRNTLQFTIKRHDVREIIFMNVCHYVQVWYEINLNDVARWTICINWTNIFCGLFLHYITLHYYPAHFPLGLFSDRLYQVYAHVTYRLTRLKSIRLLQYWCKQDRTMLCCPHCSQLSTMLNTIVNNVEQYCYTRFRLNNIVHYCWQVWTVSEQCGQHNNIVQSC